ncbi:hypothetical protein BMS3Abin17_01324 [archaeon BMS3Abin17]|nr:hypothetical protein BMS3Abin17_01324 [archaeon BMS3Abin17]HDZ60941.1 hypothetical protein [Candidatus Pacearchaeota archaeon]
MKEDNIRRISDMIPRRGISRDSKKYILPIVKEYFGGVSLGNLRSSRYGKVPNKIYSRIKQVKKDIKNKSLEKIALILGKHVSEFSDDHVFIDAAVKLFLMNDEIGKDFFNTLDLDEKQKTSLRKVYKQDKWDRIAGEPEKEYKDDEKPDIFNILKTISKDPGLYVFLKDKIIDKDFP